jgi:hypothetical protein
LEELNLDSAGVADGTWSNLFQAAFPRSLRRLSVQRAEIWPSDLFELFHSPALASLQELDLSWGALGSMDRESRPPATAGAPLALDLSQLRGTDDSTAALAELLGGCPGLARVWRLALCCVADNEQVFEALLRSPHLGNLRALDIGSCSGLGGPLLERLLGSNLAQRLTALDLSYCELGNDDVVALAGCPHLRNLTWLGLRNNYVGCRGARALAESPYLVNLRHLDLADNCIKEEGARALARAEHLAPSC